VIGVRETVLSWGRAFASEWVKMRRRRLWWGAYGAIVAVVAMTTVVDVLGARSPPTAGGESIAALAGAGGLGQGSTGSVVLLGAVALSIAAAQFGGEFTLGTLRCLLVRQPSRSKLMVGKGLAVLSFLLGAVVVASLFSMAVAFLAADVRGIPTAAWTSGAGLAHFGIDLGDLAIATCGFGVVLGVLMRSSVLAIGTGLALMLPVESIVIAAAPGSARWLPGQLLQIVAQGGSAEAGFSAALVTVAAYLAGLVAVTLALFAWQDVTS